MTKESNPKALQWFRRTLGEWSSERRYLFAPKMKPVNMETFFSVEEGVSSNQFIVEWKGRTSGVMEVELIGDVLHRSRDYFGEENHSSTVEVLDDDCIVLRTEYGGMKIREEIRLLNSDTVRLRQTIGICIKTGKVNLLGQYGEFRILNNADERV
tara:strand:+ start:138 stop:602 length:465 start_codon:yes stop_codon:yes gene_type:complete